MTMLSVALLGVISAYTCSCEPTSVTLSWLMVTRLLQVPVMGMFPSSILVPGVGVAMVDMRVLLGTWMGAGEPHRRRGDESCSAIREQDSQDDAPPPRWARKLLVRATDTP